MHVVGQKMKKSNLKNSLDPGHHHLLQHQDQVITRQKVKLLMKLYQCWATTKNHLAFKHSIYVKTVSSYHLVKANHLEFRFIESLHNTANQRNLNFCAYSARLLRKLDHALLWILILVCHSAVSVQSKQNFND